MKKNVFFFAALLLITLQQIAAQNVGIGTTTPTQKLDVNGNINISGTIMANGTVGTSGQTLTSTGNGLSWQSLGSQMGYKKCTTFDYFAGTWTVPSGVTEVMVELWGAGSGGTMNVGGTSGGYLRTVQTVTPGTSISYVVGDGGNGAALLSSDGGSTKVTFPNNLLFAASGGGGIMTNGFKGQ